MDQSGGLLATLRYARVFTRINAVFLSHSTKDKQFVEALAAELEAEKIEPWMCEVDVELGDNFVAEIEHGLREADLTILFWSPEAAHSDWTLIEWTSVLAREISEARTRLGVVLLGDCAVPELLRVNTQANMLPWSFTFSYRPAAIPKRELPPSQTIVPDDSGQSICRCSAVEGRPR